MYLTDFVCTYKLHEDSETDDVYRLQFLQAFCLDNWDDEKIEKETKNLYETVTQKVDFTDIFDRVKKSDKYKFIFQLALVSCDEACSQEGIISNSECEEERINKIDNYATFKILFMYDLFDLAHRCFCDILNTGIINTDNKNMLLNNI